MKRQWGKWTLYSLIAVICVWLVAPVLVVVPMSFTSLRSFAFPPVGISLRWFESFWTDPRWVSSLGTSFEVAFATAGLGTLLGTAAAVGIRALPARIKTVVQGLILAPLIIPTIVVAVGLYAFFLRFDLTGTLVGFTGAHVIGALPLVVVPVMAGLSTLDRSLELAASSLGAGKWSTFIRIILPAILPSVLAGALFAFVHSWDELIISLFISTPGMTSMPVRMYSAVAQDTDPTLAAVSTMVLTLTILIVFVVLYTSARRMRRINA